MSTPSTSTSSPPLSIFLLGTCDTKLHELLYLRSRILSQDPSTSIILIDVGRTPISHPSISIPQPSLLSDYSSTTITPQDLSTLPRSRVMSIMTSCLTSCLQSLSTSTTTPIHGVIAIGGSSGTSLTSAAMRRALPFLMPKLIVSTVASGDTAPYVGETDITMMYSIVDIAGKNGILDGVLDNAAGGIVGMARAYRGRESARSDTTAPNDEDGHISESDGGNSGERTKEKKKQKKKKVKVGITMFGVTTPCVDAIRSYLCPDPSSSSSSHLPSSVHEKYIFEPFIFHATGHGGRAMECLIASSNLDAVIDLTTSEIADEIVGGVMTAGPDRLRAAAERGIPQVISLGACDMVNFGPRDTLPRRFVEEKKREIYEHNSSVTLVRTNAEECRKVGEFISGQLRKNCKRPELVEVIVPTGGLSVLSVPGGVYEDKEADEVLFRAVEEGLEGSGIMVVRDKRHVNDEGFAREVAERLVSLIEKREEVDREGGDESGAGEKR